MFLIPYFVTLLLLGIPMLYMEMSMGQFTRRGPIGALSMLCPLFKGASSRGPGPPDARNMQATM